MKACLECFVKIAVVTVAQHGSDFFDRQIRAFQKDPCPVHPLLQHDLRKRLSQFLMQKRRDIVWVVGKMSGDFLQCHRFRMRTDKLYNSAGQGIRFHLCLFKSVPPGNVHEQAKHHRFQDDLRVLLTVGVLHHHLLQQRPDRGAFFKGQMDELIGELVSLRVKEKPEHIRVHGQRRKILPEEGFSFDMNTYHDDVVPSAFPAQGIPAEGLSDIAVSLTDGDQVVKLGAERLIVQMVRVIDEKEFLTVKGLADVIPFEDHNHDIIRRVALPLRHFIWFAVDDHIMEIPVQMRPVMSQFVDGQVQQCFPVCRHAHHPPFDAIVSQNLRICHKTN